MCLERLDNVTLKRKRVGYKLVTKSIDPYGEITYSSWEGPHYGMPYPLLEWRIDDNDKIIKSDIWNVTYMSGFHICLNLDNVRNMKMSYPHKCIIKCRFRKTVASGIQNHYGQVIVAREIFNCGEVE